MGEGFGDSGFDPIVKNVFGVPDSSEDPNGPEVYGLYGIRLYPIPTRTPSNWGDLASTNGNQDFLLGGDDPVVPDDMPGFSYACIVEANPPEDQPPRESCWCVGMMDKHIAQQNLKSYKTFEECERNCKCLDDVPPTKPKYPKKPPTDVPPPISDMCIETRAVKKLTAEMSIFIFRDPSKDIGTEANPDPGTPNGKAYSIETILYDYRWTKESKRECRSLNEPVKDRKASQSLSIQAQPTREEIFRDRHGEYPAYDHDRYNYPFSVPSDESVLIGYKIEFELDINPERCNTACIDWPDLDGYTFYDFCGGKKEKSDQYTISDGGVVRLGWKNYGLPTELLIAQSMGLLSIDHDHNTPYHPPGYGYVNPDGTLISWGPGSENQPPIIGDASIQTYKESMVMYYLFNLNPSQYNDLVRGQVQKGPQLTFRLSLVPEVEYCTHQFNPPAVWPWQRITAGAEMMPNDSYFQRADLNYLWNIFNTYAPDPDPSRYVPIGGY